MKILRNVGWVVVLAVSVLAAAGCAKEPAEQIQAATAAIEEARVAQASDYAPESLTAAEDAKAALEAELAAQGDRFALFRSYDKANELAAAATTAGQKARQDAEAGRERMRQEAADQIAELKVAIEEVRTMLASAPRGKGSAADLAVLQTDLTTIETSLSETESSFAAERYLDSKASAEAARQQAEQIRAAIQEAMDAKAAAKTRRG